MTQLEFTINAICKRRGVTLSRLDNVAMSMRVNFGLANNTPLLPAVASTFYYIDVLSVTTIIAQTGAPVILRGTDLGGGSGGNVDWLTDVSITRIFSIYGWETASLLYVVNGNTAGQLSLIGTAYKVTYSS